MGWWRRIHGRQGRVAWGTVILSMSVMHTTHLAGQRPVGIDSLWERYSGAYATGIADSLRSVFTADADYETLNRPTPRWVFSRDTIVANHRSFFGGLTSSGGRLSLGSQPTWTTGGPNLLVEVGTLSLTFRSDDRTGTTLRALLHIYQKSDLGWRILYEGSQATPDSIPAGCIPGNGAAHPHLELASIAAALEASATSAASSATSVCILGDPIRRGWSDAGSALPTLATFLRSLQEASIVRIEQDDALAVVFIEHREGKLLYVGAKAPGGWRPVVMVVR